MIELPAKTYIWIAAGVTDMRRGFQGLSSLVQTRLEQSPFCGHVFVFRGRRGCRAFAGSWTQRKKNSSLVYGDTRFTAGILRGSSNRNWGLMRASCQRTPKNKCGPVARPVDPTRPSVWPFLTSCPAWTLISERWKHMLTRPSP